MWYIWEQKLAMVLLHQHTHLLQGEPQVIGRVALNVDDIRAVEGDHVLQGVSPDGVDPVYRDVEFSLQDDRPVETPQQLLII